MSGTHKLVDMLSFGGAIHIVSCPATTTHLVLPQAHRQPLADATHFTIISETLSEEKLLRYDEIPCFA